MVTKIVINSHDLLTNVQKNYINDLMKELKKDYTGPSIELINRQDACDLIRQLRAERESIKVTNKVVSSYDKIWIEATEAANAAGDAWLSKSNTKPCDTGFAGIEITNKRTKFAKWITLRSNRISYRKVSKNRKDYIYSMHIPHTYWMRKELSLIEECSHAALDIFRKYGVDDGLELYSKIG